MSLLNLSPAIQEAILFLPTVTSGRPDLILADLLPIAREWDWEAGGKVAAVVGCDQPVPMTGVQGCAIHFTPSPINLSRDA
ncbi:MAG: hypothetical protein U0798_17520 [Gemmataceae bacterium]